MEPDTTTPDRVLRLRVELSDVRPPVWREIEVAADIDFWALHVAIQDAMGWLDVHLHQFVLTSQDAGGEGLILGIPEPGAADGGPRPSWDYPIGPFLHSGAPALEYLYDFGDEWWHRVTCVGARPPDAPDESLPRCVAGERACPPEDCGGPPGYERLLERLAGGRPDDDDDDDEMLPPGFDPDAFDPASVEFTDPRARLAAALDPEFGQDEGDELLGFAPGRLDARSLSGSLIDETWVETAELSPRQGLKTYDQVARRQPHLLAFVLDETAPASEEARALAHFLLVAVLRMFWKAGGPEIRRIPRQRIDAARDALAELEDADLGSGEVVLVGLDGRPSGQPILNELLADVLSDDAPATVAEGLSESERNLVFARLRAVVEVLDAELRR